MRSALLQVVVSLSAVVSLAAPLRMTVWDLAPTGRTPAAAINALPEAHMQDSAPSLRGAAPDVILLRGLSDPSSAEKLALSLRPLVYRVVLCYSFAPSPRGDPRGRAVAVLSREPAFGFQAVDWAKVGLSNLAGGFVFAGFRYGKEPICLYGLQFDDGPSGASAAALDPSFVRQLDLGSRYLARHMSWVEQKLTNQSVGLVVASQIRGSSSRPADLSLGQFLEKRGFKPLAPNVESGGRLNYLDLPTASDGGFEETIVRKVALSGRPWMGRSPAGGRSPATFDLASGFVMETAEAPRPTAQSDRLLSDGRILWGGAGAVLLVGLAGLCWYMRWQRHRDDASNQFEPEPPRPTFTVFERGVPVPLGTALTEPREMADVSLWQNRALRAEQQAEQARAILRRGLLSELADWMKQKIVVGLLAQRNTLLDSNRNGSVHLAELEGRLRRIQDQFQERLHRQQERITELERELAAKERLIQQFLQNRV